MRSRDQIMFPHMEVQDQEKLPHIPFPDRLKENGSALSAGIWDPLLEYVT